MPFAGEYSDTARTVLMGQLKNRVHFHLVNEQEYEQNVVRNATWMEWAREAGAHQPADPEIAKDIAKTLDLDAIVVGSVTRYGDYGRYLALEMRMIEPETGDLLWDGKYQFRVYPGLAMEDNLKLLFNEMLAQMNWTIKENMTVTEYAHDVGNAQDVIYRR